MDNQRQIDLDMQDFNYKCFSARVRFNKQLKANDIILEDEQRCAVFQRLKNLIPNALIGELVASEYTLKHNGFEIHFKATVKWVTALWADEAEDDEELPVLDKLEGLIITVKGAAQK